MTQEEIKHIEELLNMGQEMCNEHQELIKTSKGTKRDFNNCMGGYYDGKIDGIIHMLKIFGYKVELNHNCNYKIYKEENK